MPRTIDETYSRPPNLNPSSESAALRSSFFWLIIIWLAVFVTAPVVALYLNAKGNRERVMPIKLSNGVYLKAKVGAPSLSQEELTSNVDAILRALFCWTNKGGVEAVIPYVHTEIWKEMVRQHRTATSRDTFYEEQLRIPKGGLVFTSASRGVRATFQFRGTIVSRGVESFMENEVFYQVRLLRAPADKIEDGNALGWYISDWRKMERDEFYKESITNDIKEVTKVKKGT